ncbi:hypothetical protein RRG08_064526 [Elysia crispata]|uniref:Uncharacterized protein n=1 Tax=Elysia crispata TaxID=231223 RepID=A0AAE0Y0I7_9GAST|nr:hypothetical protein RRG08_064526 [Elysia crispata]
MRQLKQDTCIEFQIKSKKVNNHAYSNKRLGFNDAQRGHSRDGANRRRSTDVDDPVSPRLVLDLPAEDWSPLREGAGEAPAVKRKRQGRDNAGEDVNFLEGSCSDPTADDSKRRGQQLHDRKGRDREREITTPSPATTLTSSLSDAGCSVRSPGSAPSSTPGPPLFFAPSRQLTPPVGISSGGGGSGGGARHKYAAVKGNPYSVVGLALATVHLKLVTFLYSSAISTTRPSRQPSQATLTSPVPGSDTGICPPRTGHMTSNICPHHRCPHEPQDPQPDAFDDFSEEFESIAIRRRLTDNTAS